MDLTEREIVATRLEKDDDWVVLAFAVLATEWRTPRP
jgi:hypothetical protein